MPTALVFRKVSVAKAPGFDREAFPILDHLQPGLNVVWGPNGAGKSTLARALRGLLWPAPDGGCQAQAEVELDGVAWRLERMGPSLRQTRLSDNHVSQSQWGGAEDAERHWFPLHELLQAQRRDGSFQAYIRNKLQGGVDLEAACRAAGGVDRPLAPNGGETQALRRASETRKAIQSAQEQQKPLRDRLQESAAAVLRAREAGQRLGEVRQALAFLEAGRRVQASAAALRAFPEAVARLSPEDPLRLAELEKREAVLLQELQEGKDLLLRKQEDLAALKVPEGLLADGALKARIQAWCERLRALEPAWRQAQAELAKAEALEQAWQTQMSWLLPEPPEGACLPGMIQRLRILASSCEPLRCAVDAAAKRLKSLGPLTGAGAGARDTVEHWREVQACLPGWLGRSLQAALPVEGPVIPWGRARIALGGATLLVLLAAALGMLLKPWLVLAALLAPVLAWAVLRPVKGQAALAVEEAAAAGRVDREEARLLLAAFPELQPCGWSPRLLLELQRAIANRLGQAHLREAFNRERDLAEVELKQAREAYGVWLTEWREAAAALQLDGGEPALEGAQFFHFAPHLAEWLQRLGALAQARAGTQARREELAEALAALQELLRTQGGLTLPAPTVVELLAQVQELQERRERAVLISAQAQDLQERLARKGGEELLECLEALDAFWQSRGFGAPDREALSAWAALVDARRGAVLALEGAERALQSLSTAALGTAALGTAALGTAAHSTAELIARIAGLEQGALELEAEELEAEAAALEPRSTRHGVLQEQHEKLLGGDALARALHGEAVARKALELAQQENTLGRVVTLLAQELKEKTLLEEQPAVLNRASAWLRRFTRNRLSLGLHPETGFFARDAVQNRTTALEELSSGTRVQLLFAVRLAFIEELEGQSVALPVFLDEVLANADEDRALAMVEAILEIAKVRQVFYFTAQADEVGKLKALAGEGGLHEVSLEALASAQARGQSPLLPLDWPRFTLPEPLEDYDAYGAACGVAGAARFAPLEGLHAWHLYTRTLDLQAVLRLRFHQVGQVLAAATPEAAALRPRMALLGRAQVLAQQGRGRCLNPQDLEEADLPGVNKKAGYWAAVLELAQAAAGDGFRLEGALKGVPGLREDPRAALKAWLREQRYTSGEAPLDPDAILLALHREFPWLTVPSEERRVVERYVRSLK